MIIKRLNWSNLDCTGMPESIRQELIAHMRHHAIPFRPAFLSGGEDHLLLTPVQADAVVSFLRSKWSITLDETTINLHGV